MCDTRILRRERLSCVQIEDFTAESLLAVAPRRNFGIGEAARHSRYLLHDRDSKFCPVFREVIQAGKVKPLKLPARSPNLPLPSAGYAR